MTKSSAIHNLFYSRDYCTTVKEEFQIFHDLFTYILLLRDDYLEFFSVEDPRLREFKRDLMILILKFLLLHIRLGTSLKKKELRVS